MTDTHTNIHKPNSENVILQICGISKSVLTDYVNLNTEIMLSLPFMGKIKQYKIGTMSPVLFPF